MTRGPAASGGRKLRGGSEARCSNGGWRPQLLFQLPSSVGLARPGGARRRGRRWDPLRSERRDQKGGRFFRPGLTQIDRCPPRASGEAHHVVARLKDTSYSQPLAGRRPQVFLTPACPQPDEEAAQLGPSSGGSIHARNLGLVASGRHTIVTLHLVHGARWLCWSLTRAAPVVP